MKICFWINGIYKLGGTRKVVTMIANELCRDNDVTIMSFGKKGMDYYGLDSNVKIDLVNSDDFRKQNTIDEEKGRVETRKQNYSNYNKPELADQFMSKHFPKHEIEYWTQYLNDKKYDVVIAVGGLILNLAGLADKLDAKTIGWFHNSYSAYFEQNGELFAGLDEICRIYLKRLDRVYVLNDYDKIDYNEKLGLDVVVMNNPRSFSSEIKTDISQKNFFVAARFVRQKGLDLLLKSFVEFCKYDNEWNLIIAGDGPDKAKIIEFIKKNALKERVQMVGETSDVISYYLKSSIYLLSSRWEGWGLVVIEAFEMGMPVISYDITPLDLLITNGEDGIIVDAFDYVRFAAAMKALAHNEELRRNMAEKAVKKAQRFTIELIGSEWRQQLRELQ